MTPSESQPSQPSDQTTTSQHRMFNRVNWIAISSIVSAIGLMVAASGLFVTAQQVELSRKVAKAEFMRDFYSSLQEYNDLQFKLIEGGEWRIGNATAGPQTEEEWFRLQRYMGLLEQLDVWYRDGIVDMEQLDNGYSHRVKAIATHPIVQQRLLHGERFRWERLLHLVEELEQQPEYRALKYSHPAEVSTDMQE